MDFSYDGIIDEYLQTYANLIVDIGANVQEGQPVVINCPVQAYEFAEKLTLAAYNRGASDVAVFWHNEDIDRMRFEYAPMETFKTVPDWAYDRMEYYYKKNVAIIGISSNMPDIFEGLDGEKLMVSSKAYAEKMKPLDHYTMNDEVSWCIAAYPNPEWAMKVYPEIGTYEEAYRKLWDDILDFCYAKNPTPELAWKNHIRVLENRAKTLNEYQFESVHYKNSLGTDLEVRLPKNHIWLAAKSENAKGTSFIPNMPTEEVFTAPDRCGVNGKLVATKPLSYNGQLIEDFMFTFKDGKVVDFDVKKGGQALKSLLEHDEGARMLGEIALVPYESPISLSNTLFYNTLFDENASCHFAFGACYPTCIEGGVDLSTEDLKKRGGNDSSLHVDFMVGSKDLSIVGKTHDGKVVTIFKDGNFAPEFSI